jgi:hypothetical protein
VAIVQGLEAIVFYQKSSGRGGVLSFSPFVRLTVYLEMLPVGQNWPPIVIVVTTRSWGLQ